MAALTLALLSKMLRLGRQELVTQERSELCVRLRAQGRTDSSELKRQIGEEWEQDQSWKRQSRRVKILISQCVVHEGGPGDTWL